MRDGTFYVGAPDPAWLERTNVPLFVSHRRLAGRRSLPRAAGRWALDSGGFTEISKFGRWTVTPAQYVAAVRHYRDEIGGLDWAAPQDSMCEPEQLAKTGMTETQHQRLTVDNFIELRTLAPDLPIIPVVQGWVVGSHLRCVERYLDAGVDLLAEPVVGIGSICRRPNPVTVALIVDQLRGAGLLGLHGFGVTADALALAAEHLVSADSQAWSAGARHRREPCPESATRKDCRNCLHYAIEWAEQVNVTAGWEPQPSWVATRSADAPTALQLF